MGANVWSSWLEVLAPLVGGGGCALCVLIGLVVEFTSLRDRVHMNFVAMAMRCVYFGVALWVLALALR